IVQTAVAILDTLHRLHNRLRAATEHLRDSAVLIKQVDGLVPDLDGVVKRLLLIRGLDTQLALVGLVQSAGVGLENLGDGLQLFGGLAAELVRNDTVGDVLRVLSAELVRDLDALRRLANLVSHLKIRSRRSVSVSMRTRSRVSGQLGDSSPSLGSESVSPPSVLRASDRPVKSSEVFSASAASSSLRCSSSPGTGGSFSTSERTAAVVGS